MRILVKFPSKNRPERFKSALKKMTDLAFDHSKIEMLFTIEEDEIGDYPFPRCKEKSISKIHAVNRGIPKEGWDILVVMSDDMSCVKKDWDKIIRDKFVEHFPDTDGFLHFNDSNRSDICTMTIIGNKYYLRDGYVYHPTYKSLWCDQEATEVAKMRTRYLYCDEILFTHDHPNYFGNYKHMDLLYAINNAFDNDDRLNYEHRKLHNFDEPK